MQRSVKAWVVGWAVTVGGATALAQAPGSGGGVGATGTMPLSMTNPYMNPYLNPYLNPALANGRTMSGRDAAMYLYMANSANGGLGSGRLSGTRPSPVGPTGKPLVAGAPGVAGANGPAGPVAKGAGLVGRSSLLTRRARGTLPPGEMPNSASVPGSGAARFFNPGAGAARGADDHFGRRDMFFNNNRR